MIPDLKNGPWKLGDLPPIAIGSPTVFSCFHCAGGSSMGYKLAGFNVLGGVEIDPKIMAVYRKNHGPKYSYLMDISDFNTLPSGSLPSELSHLDILDGSPPCSTFSIAGLREKSWGRAKKFREGQATQILDDLFGNFVNTVEKLRPKIVVAENVKGMLAGNARGYVREMIQSLKRLGYQTQLFLLDASKMGVPQRRERVFFISNKTGSSIQLQFKEQPISLHSAIKDVRPRFPKMMSARYCSLNWHNAPIGGRFGAGKSQAIRLFKKCHPQHPTYTLTAVPTLYHWSECRHLQGLEIARVQTFPDDFNFLGQDPTYICGMSVPPFMMQRIALQIRRQMLSNCVTEKKLA